MATIKSYTDLNQSRTLSEFLSHESADQTWERIAIAGANLDVQDELQYKHNGDIPFSYYSGIGVPCWSLAALLDVLPDESDIVKGKVDVVNDKYMCTVCIKEELITAFSNNSIDACCKMIIRLNELKIL